jgi:hypothetical protein
VVRGYEDAPPGAVIQLRLLAAIFRLVLTERAPALRPYYACLGGDEPPSTAWPVMRQVIAEHLDELHEELAIAPQTNEVGRSAALLAGLFDLAAATGCRRVRLLELGASAGLNLLLDRFRVVGDGWSWGPDSSPVQLLGAVHGAIVPTDLEIVEARGCDLDPVDATSEQGRLRLTSFVWPFDVHRHERLAGALQLAVAQPPVVDRASAAGWLTSALAVPPAARTPSSWSGTRSPSSTGRPPRWPPSRRPCPPTDGTTAWARSGWSTCPTVPPGSNPRFAPVSGRATAARPGTCCSAPRTTTGSRFSWRRPGPERCRTTPWSTARTRADRSRRP